MTFGYVNSLPATVSATYTTGTSSSTSTGNLTTGMFSFGFNEFVADPNSSAVGEDIIYFTAGVDTTYSISGTYTVTGGFTSQQLFAELYDNTAGSPAYYYSSTSTSATTTLDSSGGPLTGLLTAGDVYYVLLADTLNSASGSSAGLTGNTTITFSQPSAVPEPTSLVLLGVGSSLPLMLRLRRRKSTCVK